MHPRIIKCVECGKLFKIYPHQIYEGDPNYCPSCNRKADGLAWQKGTYQSARWEDRNERYKI